MAKDEQARPGWTSGSDEQKTVVRLTVPEGYRSGERLDVYLTRLLPNASRAKVQRGIKAGRVDVDGTAQTKASYAVQAGDAIRCTLLRPPPMEAAPEPIPLDVAYEDGHLLVVNKAAGMVVHPAYGHRSGTLVNALLYHVGGGVLSLETDDEDDDPDEDTDVRLSTLNARPAGPSDPSVRPGIVHRLDKDTSGLMVVAKDDVTHAHLARQFFERTIERRYLALVWGLPEPPSGRIEAALGRDPRDRKRMAVVAPERGKHAVTHYETVEPLAHAALLRFKLETGRTHQIRVHAQHLGHPILGDPTYGGQALRYGPATARRRAFFRNLFDALPRQALHAHTLGFTHPRTGEHLHFAAELPEDMRHALEKLRGLGAEG